MATATAKKKPKPVLLPKKPSALIRIALEDLAKAERSKKCEINMDRWHQPSKGVCQVCLAGAVMRSSLAAADSESLVPSDFRGNEDQLSALDELRKGDVWWAFTFLGIPSRKSKPFNRDVTPYATDPRAFKRDMRRLAADLEAAGY